MPTLSEFALTLQMRREEENGMVWTIFRFSTLREFRAFRYDIQVEESMDHKAKAITFQIRGVRAPANLMPSSGVAQHEICYPDLHGTYTVYIAGAKQSGSFSFVVRGEKVRLVEAGTSDFVHITVIEDLEILRL